MQLENVSLQSAGSLSVAVLALFMTILQSLFFFRRTQATWYAWSAASCFAALLYSVGIFIEYNTPQGPLNRFSGLLEFTAIILLVHCLYGFTFSYLGIENKYYHPVAGIFHGMVLICLWSYDFIVAETFVVQNFIGLKTPYVEPALGPLGPIFMLYAALAGICAMVIWLRSKNVNLKYRYTYLAGMGFWLLLGIHDGLAAMGMPTFQYCMEYGFIGFSMVVVWVVFNSYLEMAVEEHYRVITELANDCILVIQGQKVVFANPACGELVGRVLDESSLENFLDHVVPEDRNAAFGHYRKLLDGNGSPLSRMVRICRPDNQQRFAEIVANRIRYRNRPAVLAILRDMTERIREEEARRKNEKKLDRLKKMEALGLLAGGVAHDLNNVLSGIVTYPDLILSDLAPDSKFRKPIEIMQKAGQRASAIVQDLLTMARRGVETRNIVNLNDIIPDYLDSPEHEKLFLFHPKVEVQTHLSAGLLNMFGSAVHLSKTIMNLVSNAAEAMPGGGRITIQTANRYIDQPINGYDSIREGDYAVVRITDTGVGISPEERERIFEPFYTKKVMGRSGTGLGMAVVWGTVKDHKGYIDIDGSTGEGTTFTLYFPATREKVPGLQSLAPIDVYKGKGEKILAVDDVEAQREIVTAILTKLGYDASSVPSGEAAVAYLKENRVDLLILDMIMEPGMDGLDTYRQVIKTRPGQKTIIASGFSETDRVREAQKLGAGTYVKKPYTLEKIGSTVRAALDE
ncbi:MAG: response regulator [Desulfobacterales bacterium]|nr:response regulator [Desulfobacterales bacterium]